MSQMGGTFVRAASDREQVFEMICRLIRERDRAWLAASPEHATCDHDVRLHAESDWISITTCLEGVATEISVTAATEVIELYCVDEHRLRFAYDHHAKGEALRSLQYDDNAWTVVRGTPEGWESAVLFSAELMNQYRKHAPQDELRMVEERSIVTVGRSIPWACDGDTITQIACALGLPYEGRGDKFLNELRRETITGLLSSRPSAKRWWRF